MALDLAALNFSLFCAQPCSTLSETLYWGEDALSTKPVMLISAPLIPATRWSCSQQSLLSARGPRDPPSSWDKGCPDKHHDIGNV